VREVSGQASHILLEVLSRAGMSADRVLAGSLLAERVLRAPNDRIDWDVFAALCDRAEEVSEGVLSLEEIGARMLVVPSFEFLRRAGQLVLTPRQLYEVAATLMAPSLFNNVSLSQTWLPTGRLVIRLELAAGYRESRAFFRLCHGNMVALPRLLDLAPSTIEEQVVSGRRGRLILVPPRSHTLATLAMRGARTLRGLGDAIRGVARQQARVEASFEALRSSRHELRQLVERLPDGVLIHRAGIVCWANAAMIALVGYRELEEIVGKNILEFLAPDARATTATAMSRAGPNTVSEERLEYSIARPDGTSRRVLAGTTQHVDFDGVTARLVVVHDVTDHHRLQEQLALADRMASIGTVAAGVAHEINNPLAYAHLNLELAARELAALGDPMRTAPIAELLRVAREGTERVRGIVRNLKTLSRAHEESLEAVDLPPLLDSMLVLAANALSPKARVTRSYGPVPAALAMQGRLGQVFLNLLLNAADAIPEGAATHHRVRVTTATDLEGRAVVEISDTGDGIPREHASQVFDPFFTTKPVGKGTGLGLSICHRLVTELGGEITFSSPPSGGTTFRVVLPPAVVRGATFVSPSPVTRSRGRVLVVDDEPALLRSLCKVVGEVHEVVGAADGREALDLLRQDRRFDVVLADLMMARVTGMDLYEAVRAAHPGFEKRIVFMTGGAFTARGREFLAQVPNRCIEKPFAGDVLFSTLGEFVDA
jgi:two-component system cell cycle sensor histidine kinase/response regulator CckA